MRGVDGLRRQIEKLANSDDRQACRCLLVYDPGDSSPVDEPGMSCRQCGKIRAGRHFIVEEVLVNERGEAIIEAPPSRGA